MARSKIYSLGDAAFCILQAFSDGGIVPIIFRQKGYAVFFVMFDLSEPIHVHVRHSHKEAKYWIEPLTLAWNRGYQAHELNEIERLIEQKRDLIVTAWHRELRKR